MCSRVRAAVSAGKPPLAFILGDPTREWTKVDFDLVTGLRLLEEMQTGTGVPIYWDRSDRVRFEVGTFISRSKQALDQREEADAKSKNKNHGRVHYPIPVAVDGGPLPTLEEWLDEQAEKRAMSSGKFVIKDANPFSNAGWTPPEG